MRNNIKDEIDKIEIPKELRERSKAGVLKAKSEMKKQKPKWLFYAMPMIAASVLIILISVKVLENNSFKSEILQSKHSSLKDKSSDNATSSKNESTQFLAEDSSKKINLNDPQDLVELGDNVFIGEVLKKTGDKRFTPEYPQTQFSVKVDKNIKGSAPSTVTVNQQGGYEGEKLILMEKDPLLEEGKTYLFITHFMQKRKWYNVTPGYGHILINNEEERANLVKEFSEAYEKELKSKDK